MFLSGESVLRNMCVQNEKRKQTIHHPRTILNLFVCEKYKSKHEPSQFLNIIFGQTYLSTPGLDCRGVLEVLRSKK